jgi:hypothetical protein
VDFDVHCAIGLGKKMSLPKYLTENHNIAHTLKQEMYARVDQIWGENFNGAYGSNLERLLNVA